MKNDLPMFITYFKRVKTKIQLTKLEGKEN